MLISRNHDDDPYNDVIPPGSENSNDESDQIWLGALTTLKLQDMSSGTDYRKYAQETLWGELEKQYTDSQALWAKDNPTVNLGNFENTPDNVPPVLDAEQKKKDEDVFQKNLQSYASYLNK